MEGEGAGDCDRVEGAVEVFAGGPFAQADFDGSCDDVFGTEAVDDLLILSLSDEEKRGQQFCGRARALAKGGSE